MSGTRLYARSRRRRGWRRKSGKPICRQRCTCHVGSEALLEFLQFLGNISDPAATHNCWAWRVGQRYRFSDDGEPAGTAGRPILQAIDGQARGRRYSRGDALVRRHPAERAGGLMCALTAAVPRKSLRQAAERPNSSRHIASRIRHGIFRAADAAGTPARARRDSIAAGGLRAEFRRSRARRPRRRRDLAELRSPARRPQRVAAARFGGWIESA